MSAKFCKNEKQMFMKKYEKEITGSILKKCFILQTLAVMGS